MNFFAALKSLSHAGVLGLNKRNADFVLRYNQRRLYPLVDNKLETKRLAIEAGIAVPEIYTIVEIPRQVRDLPAALAPFSSFAIKPARGSGGDGIIVITNSEAGGYREIGGTFISHEALTHHVLNALSGMYSLAGIPDKVFAEYRIEPAPLFEAVAWKGVPDIRLIVFLGVPVMAMARLPTKTSEGKANLHQGAVGVGISISSGITYGGVHAGLSVSRHPDSQRPLDGIAIPYWEDLLLLAARSFELTGLGFQGVDIVIDASRGPLILELNARPGLNVQIANHSGLLTRLQLVERTMSRGGSAQERVAFARENF